MSASNPARVTLHPVIVLSLLVGLIVSTVGDEIFMVIMVLQLEQLSSSGYVIALLLASQLLPGVFLSPFAGQLIDRFETSRVLVITQILQALLLWALAFTESPVLLLTGSLVLGLLFAVSQPAIYALVPVIAERGGVAVNRVNAVMEFFRRSALIVGPVLGGILFQAGGARLGLLIDALTFGLAGCVVLFIGIRRHPEVTDKTKKLFDGALEGLRVIARDPVLRVTMPVVLAGFSATSLVNVAFVFLVRDVLGGSAGTYGFLYAMWGSGMLLGAFLAGRRELTSGLERPTLLGSVFIGASLLTTGLFPRFLVMAISEFCGGVANGIHNVSLRTLLTVRTPKALHGRVFAAYLAVGNAAIMTGYLLGSPFANRFAVPLYLTAGSLTILISLFGYLRILPLKNTPGIGPDDTPDT